MNDYLPYQAAIQLTANEAWCLNQCVGRYELPNDVAIQTKVRELVIEWSPDNDPGPTTVAFQVESQLYWLAIPNACSLPQVQELLEDIPWSALDHSLKIATLQVAFQGIFSYLEQSGFELSAERPSRESTEATCTLRLVVEWLTGHNTELFLVVHPNSLDWLNDQLSRFAKQPSQDLGWLPLQADVVCGTTQLSLEEIEHLSPGDQVLYIPCGDCQEEQISNTRVAEEDAKTSCRLVFRQATLGASGYLRAGIVHRSSRIGHQTNVDEPLANSAKFTELLPGKLTLNIVIGTVECTLDEALHSQSPLAVNQLGNGLLQLQYASKVITQGHYNSLLDRPAFAVS